MKILVTGGAGFIGSHLCGRLLKEGHSVVCVDSFITGSPKNVEHLSDNADFRLLEHDITSPLPEDFDDIDLIYHLASPASPVDYREIPLQTLMTNGIGTKNVLDLAGRYFISFILASTSEVYGDPAEHPQTEKYWGNVNPLGERSCYSEGKRYAESLAFNYWRHFQFPLKVVRIFNTYGPRMRKHDGRVIPSFIMSAMSGEPLRMSGDGSQTRSFCYVDDLVDGLVAVLDDDSKEFEGAVNLGNPDEISVKELAQKIVELCGSESIIREGPAEEDDPQRRQPDISLAQKKYGFAPKVGLDEGLKNCIEYFGGLS